MELLNEIRVALPGVQVLFAFLLTVPFASGFDRMNGVERSGYFGTFLLTAGATACLMAPAAYHRARFRRDDKERLLRTANRFTVAGTALLMLAITGAGFVVTDMLYQGGPAVFLTQPDIWRFVRKLIESDLPDAVVVSFAELLPEVTLRPVARANLAGIG